MSVAALPPVGDAEAGPCNGADLDVEVEVDTEVEVAVEVESLLRAAVIASTR